MQILRGQGLPECISPQQTAEDTPKYYPFVVRFELKIAVTLLLTEENARQTYDSRLRISIEEACGVFENHKGEGRSDGIFCHGLRFMMMKICFLRLIAHVKSKSTSPIVFQKSFSKSISLSEFAQKSRQRMLRGRCNYLNRRGNEAGQWRLYRAKFKMILRTETEKRF